MKFKVVTTFDKKTALYGQPFFVRHIGDAIREWDVVRKDDKTKFGKNPEDFDLIELGEYDDAEGSFTNRDVPLTLASGV